MPLPGLAKRMRSASPARLAPAKSPPVVKAPTIRVLSEAPS